MRYCDRYQLPLSTDSADAAQLYQEGVDLLLSLWPGAAETLDQAIESDPDFALALAARARFHAIRAESVPAKAKIARAEELIAQHGTERERSHVRVLSLAIHGQSAAALSGALAHADLWPQDILILSLMLGAFGLLAFSGRADHDQARVDLCEKHAAHFSADDWWFLSYRGWSHGENGNVALGRELAERSLQIRRRNANAAHALTHVLYEAGANAEAETLIAQWLPEYDSFGVLHGHLAWHGALLALERGDAARALEIYRQHVAPPASAGLPINVASDSASFLWRMQAYGHPVDSRLWQEAADYSSEYFQQPGFPFADVHMTMLAAAVGDKRAVLSREKTLAKLVDAGRLAAGPAVPVLCRAVLAFAEERYADCARMLEPVAHEVVRIGGSGAQREIAEDTLLVAWMKSGELDKARTALQRRLHRRPSIRDSRWLASLQPA